MVDGDSPMGFPDYRGAPLRRNGGFGSTPMAVVIPYSVVPAISKKNALSKLSMAKERGMGGSDRGGAVYMEGVG
ncbi:hypothetical protein LIER_24013 [Lithospermum erythrorhizon]|uniref:Uncharacterized protein n=1 Tax=Lithospermum erythrorhizon TaxID=34254 RepID=A0AAV3QZS8_LITER